MDPRRPAVNPRLGRAPPTSGRLSSSAGRLQQTARVSQEAAYLFKLEQIFRNALSDRDTHILKPLLTADAGDNRARPLLKASLVELGESFQSLCKQTDEICLTLGNPAGRLAIQDLYLIRQPERLEEVYVRYFTALSDYIVNGGFEHIAKQSSDHWKKNKKVLKGFLPDLAPKIPVSVSLQRLFQEAIHLHVQKYVEVIQKLSRGIEKVPQKEQIGKALARFTSLERWVRQVLDVAALTRKLWTSLNAKLTEQFRVPGRRLREDSRNVPLTFVNGRHDDRLLLFDDCLGVIQGSDANSYKLDTVWVESLPGTNSEKHQLKIIVPEEDFVLNAQDLKHKTLWLWKLNQAVLQHVQGQLNFPLWGGGEGQVSGTPQTSRFAVHTFVADSRFKGALYEGDWSWGKPHGRGTMKWPDGRNYTGQFKEGQENGFGVYVCPGPEETFDCYKCHWEEGVMHGYGICEYGNSTTYKGYFRDNRRHGFGILCSSTSEKPAFKYTGHWEDDKKAGYGVFDDLDRGERYIGTWTENYKHGPGIVITQSGLCYEGKFHYNKMVGSGKILSEDDHVYEGEFSEELVLTGKGKLSFPNGYVIEGLFSNKWGSGLRTNGVFSKLDEQTTPGVNSKLQLGSQIIAAEERWRGIYQQFEDFLKSGCVETSSESFLGFHSENSRDPRKNLKERESREEVGWDTESETAASGDQGYLYCDRQKPTEGENKSPEGSSRREELSLREQVRLALESAHHPLGKLLHMVTLTFQASYSGIGTYKRLLSLARQEVVTHAQTLLILSRRFFSTSPQNDVTSQDSEEQTPFTVTLPLLLPHLYPDLFMMYMLYHEPGDALYWKGIVHLGLLPDLKLLEFLEVQKHLWPLQDLHLTKNQRKSIVKDVCFESAIECLQKISSTADAQEKMDTIMKTYGEIENTVTRVLRREYNLPMDDLLPLLVYVVSRAR
eukprot:gi/632983281/ref/XP_007908569.1/ PREDICTED: ALS2 C-terminal-like protein [Callorhinchus milii]